MAPITLLVYLYLNDYLYSTTVNEIIPILFHSFLISDKVGYIYR